MLSRFVGSSHWNIPRKTGKSKKSGPVFPVAISNGISCSIYTFLEVCTSSRSTARKSVGHRDVPGFTTKWNNFLPIVNSTFAPTEISGSFFPTWKAPLVSCYAYGNLNQLPWCSLGSRNLPQGTCDTCYLL